MDDVRSTVQSIHPFLVPQPIPNPTLTPNTTTIPTVSSSYIFDFAIIITLPSGTPARLDFTLIPLVYRYADPVNAYLCRPDRFPDGQVSDYIPQTTPNCGAHTGRASPYAIASGDYATLHPEEAAWLSGRLAKTSASVKQFVDQKLSGTGKMLSLTEAQLRIAVGHTGGGKRAMLHSMGK